MLFDASLNLRKIGILKQFHRDEKSYCEKCDHAGRIFYIDKDKQVNHKYCDCYIDLMNRNNEQKLVNQSRVPTISLDFKIDEYFNTGRTDQEKFTNNQSIAKIKEICDDIENFVKLGQNIFISGQQGTGKTVIACEIAKILMKIGYTTAYVDYSVLLINLSRFDLTDSERDWNSYVEGCRFLIIDSIEKINNSDSMKSHIFESILRYRVQGKLSTCFISSIPRTEIEANASLGCSSLMRERTTHVNFVGADFRRIKK